MHTHRDIVKRAYGIASDHPDEFESKAGYADPCRDPVSVSGSNDDAGCKWPPTLIVWSSTDQVLPMEEHAVKYAALLRARGIAVDDIRVALDGDTCLHGSWKHSCRKCSFPGAKRFARKTRIEFV
jgi:acetyl esterase/lipase